MTPASFNKVSPPKDIDIKQKGFSVSFCYFNNELLIVDFEVYHGV